MDSGDLLNAFRADAVDDAEPYLWGDSEVYQYINDAYFMFVRLTGGISDATTAAVTELVAADGIPTTALHSSVMQVRTAYNTTLKKPITVINVQDEDIVLRDDYGMFITGARDPDRQGRPAYMVIGEEDEQVRWVDVPDADYDIKLIVERLPLGPITASGQGFIGVREEHHYHLLKWVRHLAYRKQDADSFNLVKSDQERNDFIEYCELAKREKSGRRHKVRKTGYGGI